MGQIYLATLVSLCIIFIGSSPFITALHCVVEEIVPFISTGFLNTIVVTNNIIKITNFVW